MFLFSSFGKRQVTLSSTPTDTPSEIHQPYKAKSDAAPPLRVYQRAAALTYLTAPYPSDNVDSVLEVLLLLAADKIDVKGATVESRVAAGSWLGRAWKHVTSHTTAHLLQARQDDFMAAFSRQLELNPAEESNVVMVSCHCFIISDGKLHFGTLYATNCGIYFCTATVEAAANATQVNAEAGSTASDDGNALVPAVEGMVFIKERVLFTDVASLLPSIFLAQKTSAAPYIQGVPSGVVAPTALQVFTARRSTVLQFVGIQDVLVKPPRKSAAEREKSGADAVQEAPCTDVVRKREHALMEELPSNLDTLKLCALLWRLWSERLRELGKPLENPAARYAEPH